MSLRLLVITEDDPLYVIEFFTVFFDACPRDEMEIVGVTVDQAFHEPLLKTAVERKSALEAFLASV